MRRDGWWSIRGRVSRRRRRGSGRRGARQPCVTPRSRVVAQSGILRDVMSMTNLSCIDTDVKYTDAMPKLWTETIETHRREVRDAILDTAAALVADRGLRSVTMSQVAEETGIGRATLYKYFPGVEAILLAWHERQVTGH